MILTLTDSKHPKAKIALVDFRHGFADFQWLEADGSPSKIYTGDCKIPVTVTSLDTAKAEITAALNLSLKATVEKEVLK